MSNRHNLIGNNLKIRQLKKSIIILFLIFGFILFFIFGLHQYFNIKILNEHHAALISWYAQLGVAAWLIFFIIYVLLVTFSIPGATVMTILGGSVFGPVIGGLLAIMGATAGSLTLFLMARYVFYDAFYLRVGSIPDKIKNGFNENAFTYLLFLRLMPIFPFWFVNLAPAFLNVSIKHYFFATMIGIIPATLIYASLGDSFIMLMETGREVNLRLIFEPRIFAPIVGLAIIILLPVMYKKIKAQSDL